MKDKVKSTNSIIRHNRVEKEKIAFLFRSYLLFIAFNVGSVSWEKEENVYIKFISQWPLMKSVVIKRNNQTCVVQALDGNYSEPSLLGYTGRVEHEKQVVSGISVTAGGGRITKADLTFTTALLDFMCLVSRLQSGEIE